MRKVRSKLHPTEIGVIKTFSLSPNDEIGEIAVECTGCTYYYNNLAELCEKWEDYEEPKEFWYISTLTGVFFTKYMGDPFTGEEEKKYIEIGNHFETKEEAEKAVEKLKAWKRMKKCGLRFWDLDTVHLKIGYSFENYTQEDIPQLKKDLALLFGGEE